MLPIASVERLPSAWVGEQYANYLNNAALAFPAAHPCLRALMLELAASARAARCKFGSFGPALLDRVFYDRVSSGTPRSGQAWPGQFGPPAPSRACNNVSVLRSEVFSPVMWMHARRLFNFPEEQLELALRSLRSTWLRQGTLGVHLWSRALAGGHGAPAPSTCASRDGHACVAPNSVLATILERCEL